MEKRINKFISDSGYCSRRDADRMIASRKVTINKVVAVPGDKVKAGDTVRVNGNELENNEERYVYIALNKPVGVSSTTDTTDKSNVLDFVNFSFRIFHIGRLDKDSEGLLLLTNDGDIVNKILRAGNEHEKEYEVWVNKPIDNTFLENMRGGVKILGTKTRPCKVEKEGSEKFRITLTQGLNRQIRRMCEALGYQVTRLRRVRVMNITVDKLNIGEWRLIEGEELEELFRRLKNSDGTQKASAGAGAKPRKFPFKKPFKTAEGNNKDDKTAKPRNPKAKTTTRGAAPKAKPASRKPASFSKKRK